jgi:hypothetical protein
MERERGGEVDTVCMAEEEYERKGESFSDPRNLFCTCTAVIILVT